MLDMVGSGLVSVCPSHLHVHLSQKGTNLHAKTGCLTDTLLRRSGFTVPEMIDLNRKVQLLRDGMTKAEV